MSPLSSIPDSPSELDAAYLAGLFDGEAHIGAYVSSSRWVSPRLAVSLTNAEILRRLQSLWGGKFYTNLRKNPKHKTAYILNWGQKGDIGRVLTRVHPYLILKTEQAGLLLDLLRLKEQRSPQASRWAIYERLRELNRRGTIVTASKYSRIVQ